jgi:hypothetical protein
MDRKRKRLWNELQVRSKMTFNTLDVIKASFAKLFGASKHISLLNRGMKRICYDFDVVRVVRTLKNVNTAMKAFLSEPNRLYLRHTANNIIQTSSDEERALGDWNCDENYLDLSPDEEKDKDQLKRMVLYKMLPPDFNAPMIAEQIVSNCFAVQTKHLDSKAQVIKRFDLRSPRERGLLSNENATTAKSP